MAATDTFHLSVVTPERAVLDCDARFVAFPAHDGEIGILRGRAPLLCQLGIGQLRAETAEGKKELFIDGGFAQMVDNRLTILTEGAMEPAEIERGAAEKALEAARGMKGGDERAFRARQEALARARGMLRVGGR
ncbi:MAG: ATP synthase F1 subunit epsilon [Thermoanaerobaculia bacterium]|nr:ATP synthase F1 subunit epsilon [Thermoanaerobaculia bacterium]